MIAKGLFSEDYRVYWDGEYESVVKFLSSEDDSGAKVFDTFMEVIVFAASVGLREGFKSSAQFADRRDIQVSTFARNREPLGSLAEVIYLVALCDFPKGDIDLDLMRNPEGERSAIALFQQYANEGLRHLNDEYIRRPRMDPFRFIYEILEEYSGDQEPKTKESFEGNVAVQDEKVSNTPLDFKIG